MKNRIMSFIWFGYYILLFCWEWLKTNIAFALIVINPALPVNSGIVKVKTGLKSDIGLTFLANYLTLASRALCLDINSKEGALYVHWIDVKTEEPRKDAQLIVNKLEKVLKRIFE